MKHWLCSCLLWLLGSTAHAYSDPALFAAAPSAGGGGGRHFTGSPADGYSCAVCHRGGPSPSMRVTGLPAAFEPGVAYDVTLGWDDAVAPHALQLELLSEHGESPEVLLPASEAVPAVGRCESLPEGESAGYVQTVGVRQIVGVRDCGARELTFRFVAPTARRLAFSASVVRSDSSGTAEGDGVSELRTVLYRSDAAPTPAGCSAALSDRRGGESVSIVMLWLVCVALVCRRRKVRWPRWRSNAQLFVCSLQFHGCYQPELSASFEARAVDATLLAPVEAGTAADETDGASMQADAQLWSDAGWQARRLFVRVRTAPFGGRYVPRNVGAIWIEDAQGRFVKTLARWAGTRAMYLRGFAAASQGDLTDAVTSATLDTHELHELTWNLRDRAGVAAPFGMYRVAMETTDRDASGAIHRVEFSYGAEPFVITPEQTAQFRELELRLE
jgi:hypothetical protein